MNELRYRTSVAVHVSKQAQAAVLPADPLRETFGRHGERAVKARLRRAAQTRQAQDES